MLEHAVFFLLLLHIGGILPHKDTKIYQLKNTHKQRNKNNILQLQYFTK